jgi:hypothetical protein
VAVELLAVVDCYLLRHSKTAYYVLPEKSLQSRGCYVE